MEFPRLLLLSCSSEPTAFRRFLPFARFGNVDFRIVVLLTTYCIPPASSFGHLDLQNFGVAARRRFLTLWEFPFQFAQNSAAAVNVRALTTAATSTVETRTAQCVPAACSSTRKVKRVVTVHCGFSFSFGHCNLQNHLDCLYILFLKYTEKDATAVDMPAGTDRSILVIFFLLYFPFIPALSWRPPSCSVDPFATYCSLFFS